MSNLASRRNLAAAPMSIASGLSPTAGDFSPGLPTPPATARGNIHIPPGRLAVRELSTDSSHELSPRLSLGGAFLTSPPKQKNQGVIGSGPARRPAAPVSEHPVRIGTFTSDDGEARAFVVSGVPGFVSVPEHVATCYKVCKDRLTTRLLP